MSIKRTHLTQLRKSQNLTAVRLAELAGLTENLIYAVERGRNSIDVARAFRWAQALDIAPETAFPELFATGGDQ